MTEIQPDSLPSRHPILSIVLVLLLAAVGFVIGPFIAVPIATAFYDGTVEELMTAIQSMDKDARLAAYLMQGFATLIGLIVMPILYLRTEQRSVMSLFQNGAPPLSSALSTIAIVVTFMGVNSLLIDWNSNVNFPEFLDGFESWAREKETVAADFTKYLTQFDSVTLLLVGFFVIAVLPAIGEELVFRGMIQNYLLKATRNPHVSIWIAAFLFSAIHFQFFGFLPRLALGALFGYLYLWSGNIWIAIIAHFVNNGFSVIAIYLYQRGTVGYDL